MRAWLLAVAAACSHHAPAPDAFVGPATLTIDSQVLGMIRSDPAGILCGSCALTPPMTCPDPQSSSVCAADFDAGTTVTLAVTEQQLYFGIACKAASDPSLDALGAASSCSFVMPYPLTVTVVGATDVR